MIAKLVELILRTSLNATVGRFGQRQARPAVTKPSVPAAAWLLGNESISGPEGQYLAGDPIALNLKDIRRGCHWTGAIGSGKTTGLLGQVEFMLRTGVSFVVVDLRGDLIDRVKLRLLGDKEPEYWRERLLEIDLRNPGASVAFNPLAGPGSAHSRAQRCMDIVRARSLNWGVQIEDTLYACFLALASVSPAFTLLELETLLTSEVFRMEVLSALEDPYALAWFARFEALTSEQRLTWTLAAVNKVTPLLTMPAVRRMVGQRQTVRFREVFDRPGSVVLIGLNYAELHSSSYILGSLLVSAIIQAVFSRADVPEGNASRPPVCLVIDEFEHLVSPDFAELIQESRRFGMFASLSHQNLSQLPDKLSDLLLNNIHVRIAYQTGSSDASRISREVGGELGKEVAASLLRLPVGQAYMIEKGGATRLVQFANSPDPKVDAGQLLALSRISAESFARPSTEVDAELASRLATVPDAGPSKRKRQPPTPKDAEPDATYEVRPRRARGHAAQKANHEPTD